MMLMQGCKKYASGECDLTYLSCGHINDHGKTRACADSPPGCPDCEPVLEPPLGIEEARHQELMAKMDTIQGEYRWYPLTDSPIRYHGIENDDLLWVIYENAEVDTFCAGDVSGKGSNMCRNIVIHGIESREEHAMPIGWRKPFMRQDDLDDLLLKAKEDDERDGI